MTEESKDDLIKELVAALAASTKLLYDLLPVTSRGAKEIVQAHRVTEKAKKVLDD